MRKVRLVSIALGVLILLTGISGVALAQMVEEPTQYKCETLWWYDNEHYYPQQKEFCGLYMYKGLRTFKTKAECEEALRNSIPDYENFFLKRYSIIGGYSVSTYTRMETTESTDKKTTMRTVKDIITVEKTTSSTTELLIWLPELSITFDATTSLPVLDNFDPEQIFSTSRYAIKENGQWKFVDEETFQAKEEEFMGSIIAKELKSNQRVKI